MATIEQTNTKPEQTSNTVQTVQTKQKKNGGMNEFFMRMGILGELLAFLWKRKLYWLLPMIITLMVFAVLIVIGSSGPGGVFIYSLI